MHETSAPSTSSTDEALVSDASAQRLFVQIIHVATLCCLAYSVIMGLVTQDVNKVLAPLVIACSGLVSKLLIRQGRIQPAFVLFFVATWLATVLQSARVGGLNNPVLHINIVLVVLTGWLLGMRLAAFFLTLSLLWLAFLAWAIDAGVLNPPNASTGQAYVLAISAVWVTGYFLMRLVLTEHARHIRTIQALERSLRGKVQELEAQTASALRNERKVAQLLHASPLPITVASLTTGVYIDVNPAWERHFGLTKAEVVGKTSVQLGFWATPQARQGWLDQFDAHGRVSAYEAVFNIRNSGQRVYLLSSEQFHYGDEPCVLTMSVDITERRQLENELKLLNQSLESRVQERTQALASTNEDLELALDNLRRTQDELLQSEKLASLGSLVAGFAHELNTPIGNALITSTSISDDAQALRQASEAGVLKRSSLAEFLDRLTEGANLTQRSLERAAELVSSFKQVAVDQATERRRTFDVGQVTKEVVETMVPTLSRRGVELHTDIEFGLEADSFPGPLGQVLMNCLNNALMHAFDGVDAPHIRIQLLGHENDQVLIHIMDNGVGIAHHHIERIFDPFFTTKMGRGGSGIGLSISHRLVTKVLGGRIAVRSEVGRGSHFTVSIPRVAPATTRR